MSKLKDSRIIRQISYLHNGERKIIVATSNGTFKFNTTEKTSNGRKIVKLELTAREFVTHPNVQNCDPVITLKSGDKIRVYDGGDPSYLPAMVDGTLERNDKFEVLRRKFLKQKEDREKTRMKNKEKSTFDTDEYESPFWGWDDYHD